MNKIFELFNIANCDLVWSLSKKKRSNLSFSAGRDIPFDAWLITRTEEKSNVVSLHLNVIGSGK